MIDEIQKVPGLLDEVHGLIEKGWVFHELCAHREYSDLHYGLAHWRLAAGTEVDFVLGNMEVAVEVKAARRATSDHLKGLREIHRDHPGLRERLFVCLEDRPRRTDDGILILPAPASARRLWAGEIMGG